VTATTRLSIAGGLATVLASLSLLPVTGEDPWLPRSIVAVALIVGVGRLSSRYHVPRVLVPFAQLAVATWWVVLLYARDVAFFEVFPTRAAFVELADLHRAGFTGIQDYAAPTPADAGIMLLCVEGVALIAIAVDVLAVQLRRAPLAGIPLISMYAVASAVVSGGVPWVLFVLLAVGYLALLVADGRLRVSQWGRSVTSTSSRRAPAESSTLTRSGERVGAVAVALAVAIPALVPGLSNGVFGRGGGSGEGDGSQTIRTTNPIVDLKRDLTQPNNIPVMRYRTTAAVPDYIREVTLDSFDGEEWRTSNRAVPSTQRVSRGLPTPPGLGSDVPRTEATYNFRITDNYDSPWLPLPYPAQVIEIEGDWRYDVGSLDVVARTGNSRGRSYEVTSLEVRPSDGQLSTSGVDEELARFTSLPEETVALVRAQADELTAEATNSFERAVALQSWFRSEFEYSLDRDPGNSTDALASFLEDKSGYCEQFAATMAIMARALGIPARVAVGFLPGSNEDGVWTVTARDKHAWPELWFDGVGWVRFEPTPAQRTGSAPSWTIPPVGSSSTSPAAPLPGAADGTTPDAQAGERLDPGGGVEGGAALDTGTQVPWRWIITAIAVLLALAVPAVTAVVNRRVRWRRAAGDPTQEAEAAWDDLRDSSRDAGLGWDPASTPRAAGAAVIAKAGLVESEGELVSHVVSVAERARYAPEVSASEGLRKDSVLLRKTLLSTASPTRRVLARVWPASTRDVYAAMGERVADVFDWLDSTGGRVRRTLGGWLHRHPHS